MDLAFDNFLVRCEALTSKEVKLSHDLQLKVQSAHVGGWLPPRESATAYADDVVIIVRSLDSKAMVVTKKENFNPVVGRDTSGEVFRYHDEWRDIEAHVMSLGVS